MKKERGITLVALVITIIVLLILAGVMIAQASTGTGLFARAKNASNTYKNSVVEENAALKSWENEYDKAYNDYVAR